MGEPSRADAAPVSITLSHTHACDFAVLIVVRGVWRVACGVWFVLCARQAVVE